jgi:hypothetical protein
MKIVKLNISHDSYNSRSSGGGGGGDDDDVVDDDDDDDDDDGDGARYFSNYTNTVMRNTFTLSTLEAYMNTQVSTRFT